MRARKKRQHEAFIIVVIVVLDLVFIVIGGNNGNGFCIVFAQARFRREARESCCVKRLSFLSLFT